MEPALPRSVPARAGADDAVLARRIAGGEIDLFETIMRRHNTRLFRAARAILRNDAEAEDAVQEAYIQAYRRLGDFRGDAHLSTWLTRIVINQALGRLRQSKRDRVVVPFDARGAEGQAPPEPPDEQAEPASHVVLRRELRDLIERRLDELPVAFRTVFVLREVQELSVEETAECLAIPPATVRTRLFRARALLRAALARDLESAAVDVFGFAGERCDRIVATVMARIGGTGHPSAPAGNAER